MSFTARRDREPTLASLFQAQAAATPDYPAVSFRGSVLTYAELRQQVDTVARCLASRNLGRGDVVGIAIPRSPDLVVGLLGVVCAGAAYLPLDTDLPASRVAYMLEDAGASCVLTTDRTPEALLQESPAKCLSIDASHALAEAAADAPEPLLGAQDAAYVIYTSGSTGKPKGVLIEHASIVGHLRWMQDQFALAAQDRVIHKTPIGFDVSVWELFWPLVNGAELVLSEPGEHREPDRLAALFRRERITVAHFVPAMLDAFLAEPAAARCADLRLVISSGEELQRSTCDRFFATLDASLFNLYGPTEAAIDVTSWQCQPAEAGRVPIGRPVTDTAIHILDESLKPVVIGEIGEIYICGTQLARGYVRSAILTAERFTACPICGKGQRMYRSGDSGFQDGEGILYYTGRIDDQVKVGGVRVEPGEVESALLRCQDVVQAAVVAVPEPTGGTFLAAYVVPRSDGLRRLLALENSHAGTRSQILRLEPDFPVCTLNESEARFLFDEIFRQEVYAWDGPQLDEGSCVFDVGANIGLFSLYAVRRAPNIRIFAFEPAPVPFEILKNNLSLHAVNCVALPVALGAEPATDAAFMYYPRVSLLSGLHADAAADARVLSAFVGHELAESGGRPVGDDLLKELVTDRLVSERLQVPVTTVSQVIDEHSIERISLLKIDVEQAELSVLEGIEARHWGRIDRIFLEVHDLGERLAVVEGLLESKGFVLASHTDGHPALEHLRSVRAVRPGLDAGPREPLPRALFSDAATLAKAARESASAVLPPAMVPQRLHVVPQLPLSANGKVDRRSLATGFRDHSEVDGAVGSSIERIIAGLMAHQLGVGHVDDDADFFALGGTSMAAIRLTSAISRRFNVHLRLRNLIGDRTAVMLAERIAGLQTASDGVKPR